MFNRGKIFGGLELDYELDFVAHTPQFNSADQNSYTFASSDIGDAHPDRMVVVAVSIRVTALVTVGADVTLGGVSMNKIGSTYGFATTQLFWLKVPTGTAEDIVVTRDSTATPEQCGIAVYSFNTPATAPLDSGQTQASGTNSISVFNIECANGGVVIGASVKSSSTAGTHVISWNGTDSAVEDTDAVSNSVRRMFGHVLTTEDKTTNDFNSNISGSGIHTVTVASFEGP